MILRLFLIAAAFLCGLQLLHSFDESSSHASTAQTDSYLPDFTITQAKIRRFNIAGALESVMYAQNVQHYPDLNLTLMHEPRFTFYPSDNKSYWYLTASEGTLNHDNHTILFDHDVTLLSSSAVASVNKLTTDSIELDYRAMIAHSDQAVSILGDYFSLKGLGFFAFLNEERIELLQNIQGRYDFE